MDFPYVFAVYMRPGEGWQAVPEHGRSHKDVRMVRADIRIEGSEDCIVCIVSQDESIYADTWFETLEEALNYCKEYYGLIHWPSES
ncbi:MAG: hypothetical protein MK193_06895 [Lentisphaeria bacterium]|nr:hypothetical protein [Lentisphaeria bacterium]